MAIKQCPNCNKTYETDYPTKEMSPVGTNSREQFITGICSDKCWNEYLGIGEEE